MLNKLTTEQTKTLIVLLFCTAIAAFFMFDAQQWLNLETLKQNRQSLLNYTEQHYLVMLLGSALIYILTTALSVPGATILSLAIGFLFGRWMGTLLIVVAATAGATLVFWLARYLIAEWAEQRLRQYPQAKKLISGFDADAFNYLLFLRLIPAFPFWLVNIAPAFTPIKIRTYILATFIGIIPGSFVYANLGMSLGQLESIEQLLSLPVLFAFVLLGCLALIPVLMKTNIIPQWPSKK